MKKLFERVIAILDFIIPKNEKIIVFGGNERRGINGNVASVIKAWPSSQKTNGFKAYVVSIHNEKFPGIEVIDPRSIKGIGVLLKAHTAVYSHISGDLYWHTLYNRKKRRIINLWHGAPLKRIVPWRGWAKTTVLIAASKMERLALSACIELPLENIYITGFPRMDRLITSQKKLKREAMDELNLKDTGQKWLLYAPTYRKSSEKEGLFHRIPDFSYAKLKKFLIKNNAYLLVRHHINYQFSDFEKNDRIIMAGYNEIAEIEPTYALADMLITDYSSSIFEYVVLNRPIVGFAPDLEEYEKTPGLLYDYHSIFPGPVATDWEGLKNLIEGELKKPSNHESVRADRLQMFQQFLDGKSTKRVIDLICDISIK